MLSILPKPVTTSLQKSAGILIIAQAPQHEKGTKGLPTCFGTLFPQLPPPTPPVWSPAGGMSAVRGNRFLADGPPSARAENAVNVTPAEGYAVVTTCLG